MTQAIARQVTVEVDVSGSRTYVKYDFLKTVRVQHSRAGKIKLVAPAVAYNGRKMEVRRPPPWLSEHTDEVGAQPWLIG